MASSAPTVASVLGRTVSQDALPASLAAVLANWQRMYVGREIGPVRTAAPELYSEDAVFDDPIVLVFGRGPVYRQFAALRPMTTDIELTVSGITVQAVNAAPNPWRASKEAAAAGSSKAGAGAKATKAPGTSSATGSGSGAPVAPDAPAAPEATLLRVDIQNDQKYMVAVPALLKPLVGGKGGRGPVTTISVTSSLWLDYDPTTGAVGHARYHRDAWVGTKTTWAPLRRGNAIFIDAMLRLFRVGA